MGRIHDFSYLKLRLQITIQLSDAWLFYSIVFRLSRITFPAGHNQWNNTITPAINDIAVAPETELQQEKARRLAEELSLPTAATDSSEYSFLLVSTDTRLELRQTGENTPGPVFVDFTGGKADYRRRYGNSRQEGVVRAVACKRSRIPTVLDATGGLGRDAFVMATHGCAVTICEKQPVIAALLEDGIRRAAANPKTGKIIQENLQLITGDSLELMIKMSDNMRPEVVYLDPMFPGNEKGAQVKKESQILRLIAGKDFDSPILLQQALKTALNRVVVKRPASALPINGPKPDLVFKTKKNRFDVYLAKTV